MYTIILLYNVFYSICIDLLYTWGIIFILLTTLIGIFKKEKDNNMYFEDNHEKIKVVQNYLLLWDILKLPSVRILAILLLTSKVTIKRMLIFF